MSSADCYLTSYDVKPDGIHIEGVVDSQKWRPESSGFCFVTCQPTHKTYQQQGAVGAIIGEIEKQTGHRRGELWDFFKRKFEKEQGREESDELISFTKYSRKQTMDYIDFLLRECSENDWHLEHDTWKGLEMKQAYRAARFNKSCVCGEKRNIHFHHLDVIGMGNDRRKVDPKNEGVGLHLCAACHSKIHTGGWQQYESDMALEGLCEYVRSERGNHERTK